MLLSDALRTVSVDGIPSSVVSAHWVRPDLLALVRSRVVNRVFPSNTRAEVYQAGQPAAPVLVTGWHASPRAALRTVAKRLRDEIRVPMPPRWPKPLCVETEAGLMALQSWAAKFRVFYQPEQLVPVEQAGAASLAPFPRAKATHPVTATGLFLVTPTCGVHWATIRETGSIRYSVILPRTKPKVRHYQRTSEWRLDEGEHGLESWLKTRLHLDRENRLVLNDDMLDYPIEELDLQHVPANFDHRAQLFWNPAALPVARFGCAGPAGVSA